MRIELYIVSSGNPAKLEIASAKWSIVAFADKDKVFGRKEGDVILENSTTKKAALTALRNALQRFDRAAVIKLYIKDHFVRSMLVSNMPRRWADHDWRLFRYNGEIKYLDLWQQVNDLLKNHAVSYATPMEIAENKIIKEMEARK